MTIAGLTRSSVRKGGLLLISPANQSQPGIPVRRPFNYGWVIVIASAVIMILQAGIMYSYGIFFKHLIAEFGWSRAATSGVHSLFMISNGVFAIVMGWMVDRSGPARVMFFCSLLTGLGLVLTSRVTELWQLYLTYGVIVGIGISATFITVIATTARWFSRRRGLALGIVSSGVGLGTLVLIPVTERLIAAYGWSLTYVIIGLATWAMMSPASLFLRRNPGKKERPTYDENGSAAPANAGNKKTTGLPAPESGMTTGTALRHRQMWMLIAIYFLFNFCLQMVMVHLVNYATDMGTPSFIAATFISIVGAGSLIGRLLMGTASDRIGSHNALLICCTILMVTMVWLVFSGDLWMFYAFAIVFGFAYGGEIPQMPVLIGRYFGLRSVAALVGMVVFGATFGGAIGAWAAGRLFDITQNYQLAFSIAAVASFLAVVMTLRLKQSRPPSQIDYPATTPNYQ